MPTTTVTRDVKVEADRLKRCATKVARRRDLRQQAGPDGSRVIDAVP